MINNYAEIDFLISRFTLSAVNIFTADIINDNNEYINADHFDNIINNFKTVIIHN